MKLDSSIAAVITGGASGLGAATARRLAAAGVKVAPRPEAPPVMTAAMLESSFMTGFQQK